MSCLSPPHSYPVYPPRSAHLTALKLMASSILDDGSDGTAGGGAMPTVVTDVLGAAINGATGGDEGNGYGGGRASRLSARSLPRTKRTVNTCTVYFGA